MSRFFAQQEEDEPEEKLETVAEEPVTAPAAGDKKKKKKQPRPEEQPAAEVPAAAPEAKKKKKGGAPSAAIQKALEERKRKDNEARLASLELFDGMIDEYFAAHKTRLLSFFVEYVRSAHRQKKKQEMREKGLNLTHRERVRRERDAEMRAKAEQLLGERKTEETSGPVSTRRRKKPVVEAAAVPSSAPVAEPVEAEKPFEAVPAADPAPAQLKAVDFATENWEAMLEDVSDTEATSASASAPSAQPLSAPERKPKPRPTPREAKEKAPAPTFRFRSPIICVMGHVDTGKTKILDNIRQTNVQGGEAGGITQQIGASFFPHQKLLETAAKLDARALTVNMELPGLLVIDTPGHESFSNLRNRGSSLCDFAVVVVDVMHGIENQTIESIRMLQEKGTPFLVALNKIDRIFNWKALRDGSSFTSLAAQTGHVRMQFEEKMLQVVEQLMHLDINVKLYWENTAPLEYVSMVPTSALTGEGMPDLLGYIAHYCQTHLASQITANDVDFKATVLEVKKVEGIGCAVDVVLVNGELAVEDRIVLSGFEGPIVTTVKAVLTPHPLREMRVKNEYVHHKSVKGALGVRLSAPGLDKAIAGSAVFIVRDEEDVERHSAALAADISRVKKIIRPGAEGVGVAASTLGSLEALLVFLRGENIPVSHINIGDVTKSDLQKVVSPFLAVENKCKKREFLTILCFEVRLLADAAKFAEENGVKIIHAKIIYHLCDEFRKHVKAIAEQRKNEEGRKAVFPCELKIVAAFNKKDPLILGVDVVQGVLRPGTPLCVFARSKLLVGTVETIEANHKSLNEARKPTGSVAVRIKSDNVALGRHFEETDELTSVLTRESIDALKEHFRDEMTKTDWDLVRKLKTAFQIQ